MQFLEDLSNRFSHKNWGAGGGGRVVSKILENWKMLDLEVVNEGNK